MAYMYIKPVQKSEADKIDGFFSILMHIDKVVTSYNYLQFKLPKKKNGPILKKCLLRRPSVTWTSKQLPSSYSK